MSFFQNGSIVQQLTSTATSGGTTVLTASSKQYQIFTGTSAQTIQLPNATTMKNGMVFTIINDSTGTLTVNYADSSLATTISSGTSKDFVLFDNGTSNGTFDISVNSSGGGGASQADLNLVRSGQLSGFSTTSAPLVINPEEMGADVWLSKNAISAVSAWGAGSALNGYLYVMGGLDSAVIVATVSRFNPDDNYWISRQSLTNAIIDQASASSAGGFIYSIGGDTGSVTAAVEKYTDSTNVWSIVTSLPAGSQEIRAFALKDIYAFGGSNPANASANSLNYLYSEANNAWYTRTPTITATAAPAVFTLNSAGYKAGGNLAGNAGSTYQSVAEKYNEVINAWASIASLGGVKAYTGNGDNNANGLGYVVGGKTPSDTAVVERYQDFSNSWSNRTSLSSAREGSASGAVNHQLIAVSGYNGSYITSVESFLSSNLYKANIISRMSSIPSNIFVSAKIAGLTYSVPAQIRTDGDNWKTVIANDSASMLKLNESLSTKFLESGLVYIAGGAGAPSSYTSIASTEGYNVSSNAWTTKANMITARAQCFSFALGGAGYVTGGNGPSLLTHLALTSTEKYDEIANVYSSKTAMPAGYGNGIGMAILGYGYAWGGGPFGDTVGTTPVANYQYNSSTDSWTTKATIPNNFAQCTGWMLNERGYITSGGQDTSGSTQAIGYAYNPVNDVWVSIANAPNADRQVHGHAAGGFGYRVAGVTVSSVATHKYDPGANSWSTVASLNANGTNGAGLASGGVGYSVNNDSSGTQAEAYNTAANTWTTIGSTATSRRQPTCNFTPGVYRNYEVRIGIPAIMPGLGGNAWATRSAPLSSAGGSCFSIADTGYLVATTSQRYSKILDTWYTHSTMPDAQDHHSAGMAFHGFGYGLNPGSNSGTADKYNPETQSWSAITSANTNGHAIACPLNGFGYLNGGFTSGGSTVNATHTQYNDATNAWTAKTSMSTVRAYHTLFNLNGFLQSCTGITTGGSALTALCEQYDDAGNVWAAITSVPASRQQASYLPGGIIAGGSDGASPQSTSFQYNPVSNLWTYRTSIPTANIYEGSFNVAGDGFATGNNPSSVMYQYVGSLKSLIAEVALDIS